MSNRPIAVPPRHTPRTAADQSKNRTTTLSLERLLEMASRRVSADTSRLLAGNGVQREEWRVLQALSDEQGRAMGELALEVEMNHPTLTKLIDKLVGKSWVLRRIDPRDSRRVMVFITDLGLRRADSVSQPLQDSGARWEEALGARRAKQLRALLGALLEAEA